MKREYKGIKMLPTTSRCRANVIVFISSFCVMVIELIAARMLAPNIGVSIYTWTSVLGVILSGISIGNFLGGKIADQYSSSLVLAVLLFSGGLLTVVILPAITLVTAEDLFGDLPIMLSFISKTSFIFFMPALVLSTISPLVIKLALLDLRETGGVVGAIYAFSTVGAIFGTFFTGFYFIPMLGTRMIIWMTAAILIITGAVTLFAWKPSAQGGTFLKRFVKWPLTIAVTLAYLFLFQYRAAWQGDFTTESNYFTIRIDEHIEDEHIVRILNLDKFDQSYVIPDRPDILVYDYLKVFEEVIRHFARENPAPSVLHLGGGGYCLPKYINTIYTGSLNEVVEIDPVVTKVAQVFLGLPLSTGIQTFNQDARSFLIKRKSKEKYDIIVGDVFNDYSTPFHLSTLEFGRLVKSHMHKNGIYLLNVNDYVLSQYTPSFIYTLEQVFHHVYLFSVNEDSKKEDESPPVIASTDRIIVATDRRIDLSEYMWFVSNNGREEPTGHPLDEKELQTYLAQRKPLLLTDDYAPTDILLAPIFRHEYAPQGSSVSWD